LFSHLTDVFGTLGEDLTRRALSKHAQTLEAFVVQAQSDYGSSSGPRGRPSGSTTATAQPGGFVWPPPHPAIPPSSSAAHDKAAQAFADRAASKAASKAESAQRQAFLRYGSLLVVRSGEVDAEVFFPQATDAKWSAVDKGKGDSDLAQVKRTRVGPGFACYCPPPLRTLGDDPTLPPHRPLGRLADPKLVPAALRTLPRCERAVAAVPSSGQRTAQVAAGSLVGAGPPLKGGGVPTGVVVELVPGRDLEELLKQPDMAPLKTYLKEMAAEAVAQSAAHAGAEGGLKK